MFDQAWQRLDLGARLALPVLTTLLCTLLGVLAWPLPYLGPLTPPLALIAIYYWAIHRPDLLRPSMVFGIGILHDILHMLPIGLSALLFVAAYQVILHQRRFLSGHSFFMMWSGFGLAIFGVMLCQWIAIDLIRWELFPLVPVIAQVVMAIIFFPLPCWLFIRLQRIALTQG